MAAITKRLALLCALGAVTVLSVACSAKTTQVFEDDPDSGDGEGDPTPTKDAGAKKDSGKDAAIAFKDAGTLKDGTTTLTDGTTPPPPDDASNPPPPTDSGNACVLNVTTSVQSCDDCLQASCCDVTNACFTDQNADCVQLDGCINHCFSIHPGDAGVACADQCLSDHDQSAQLWQDQAQCLVDMCNAECS